MLSMIPVPIVHYVYSIDMYAVNPDRRDDDLKLIEFIDKLSKEQYPSTPSNVMSWRSEWDSHNVHREVMKYFLKDLFAVFSNDIYFDDAFYTQTVLIDSWLSVQREGDWIRRHNHHSEKKFYSFCYYLNMGNNSAPINFHAHNIPSPWGNVSDKKAMIYPSEGTLLIFDGDLDHSVDSTIDDRYTIAGNIIFADNGTEILETSTALTRKKFENFLNNEN